MGMLVLLLHLEHSLLETLPFTGTGLILQFPKKLTSEQFVLEHVVGLSILISLSIPLHSKESIGM
jgi:hypothetical protein